MSAIWRSSPLVPQWVRDIYAKATLEDQSPDDEDEA